MKHIRILKETTGHWKGVPTGTVIAMMNDEDVDSVIKNGEGELVAEGERFTSLQNIEDRLDTLTNWVRTVERRQVLLHDNHREENRLDNIEQRQQKEAQRLLELNLQVQRLAESFWGNEEVDIKK